MSFQVEIVSLWARCSPFARPTTLENALGWLSPVRQVVVRSAAGGVGRARTAAPREEEPAVSGGVASVRNQATRVRVALRWGEGFATVEADSRQAAIWALLVASMEEELGRRAADVEHVPVRADPGV